MMFIVLITHLTPSRIDAFYILLFTERWFLYYDKTIESIKSELKFQINYLIQNWCYKKREQSCYKILI